MKIININQNYENKDRMPHGSKLIIMSFRMKMMIKMINFIDNFPKCIFIFDNLYLVFYVYTI